MKTSQRKRLDWIGNMPKKKLENLSVKEWQKILMKYSKKMCENKSKEETESLLSMMSKVAGEIQKSTEKHGGYFLHPTIPFEFCAKDMLAAYELVGAGKIDVARDIFVGRSYYTTEGSFDERMDTIIGIRDDGVIEVDRVVVPVVPAQHITMMFKQEVDPDETPVDES